MPIIINEIVITTNIDKNESQPPNAAHDAGSLQMEQIVKQAVEKVLEILEEKKQR
jgi:hypothetical protein